MIWRRLIRPLLSWLVRIAAVLVVVVGAAWIAGVLLIRRAEPERSVALPPDVPGRLVTAAGRVVHVVEQGEGPPLVLVHGFAGSTLDWEGPVLSALARTHRVIAVDLLGMGFSARADDLPYGFGLWSEQVVAVMDALGVPRATLVGHSLGGAVASIVAGEYPERVEKLVLVAPLVPLEQSERQWFFKLAEMPAVGEVMLGSLDHLPALPGFDAAYHARAHEIFQRHGTREALLVYLRHGRDVVRLGSAYRRIRAPTLVVAGGADDVVPPAAVRRWTPAIDGALLFPMDGVGHWVMRDAPDRLLAAMGEFLHD